MRTCAVVTALVVFLALGQSARGLTGKTYDECDALVKGCLGFPEGCISHRSCKMLTSYEQNPMTKGVMFDIQAELINQPGYVAMALSTNGEMPESSVTFCYQSGDNTGIGMSWNKGYHDSVVLPDPHIGLTDLKSSFQDGILNCSFTRQAITMIPAMAAGYGNVTYNLSLPYYLMLVQGEATIENGHPRLHNHHKNYVVTGSEINFNVNQIPINTADTDAMRQHGAIMVTYTILMATGMISVGISKHWLPETELFGLQIWFVFHRTLMQMAWGLHISGTIIIVADRGLRPIKDLISKGYL